MPPKGPREFEGGPERRETVAAELIADNLVERYGIEPDEAEQITHLPLLWLAKLGMGEPGQYIYASALAEVTRLETAHGPSLDWDILRVEASRMLIATGHSDEALELLAGVYEVERVLEDFVQFLIDGFKKGRITEDELMTLPVRIQEVFARRGREDDFVQAARRGLANSQAEIILPTELDALCQNDAYWPEGIYLEGRQFGIRRFMQYQTVIHSGQKIERKDVEALKGWLSMQEQASPAEIWDRLRFIEAMELYDAGAANFGRGMVRVMAAPEVQGAVSHRLIERDMEHEALDAAHEITDGVVFARTLHLGEWRERAPIDRLLTDLTVANSDNIRRYDPDFRIEVAVGLHGLHEESGDQEMAAHLAKRVELLRKQKTAGYIVAPKKSKQKK